VLDDIGPAPRPEPAPPPPVPDDDVPALRPAAAASTAQIPVASEATRATTIAGDRTLPARPKKKRKTKARKSKPREESAALDAALDDLFADSKERPDTIDFLDEGTDESTAAAPAKPGPRPPAVVVRCPACRATSMATERLAGGRVRCQACKQLFLPTGPALVSSTSLPAAAPKPVPVPGNPFATPGPVRGAPLALPVAQRPSRRSEEDQGEAARPVWKRPGPLAAVVAVVVLLYFSPRLWTSHHARVYPARGQAFYDGQPIARASVVLFPTWTDAPDFPRPHGVVGEDGSFVLETYGNGDGAPPGEYKAVVTLFLKREGEDFEGSGPPKNILPTKYASFKTSDLTVQIKAEPNEIPPLELKR
jgi:hypothetical protein